MSTVTKTMNAVITTGEYTNAQGEQKKSYLTIGTLFMYADGGLSLKLDAVPIGNANINFYEKEKKNQQPQGQAPQQGYQPHGQYSQPTHNPPQQGQQIGTAPNGSPIYA